MKYGLSRYLCFCLLTFTGNLGFAAVHTVTDAGDAGGMTLRKAIADAEPGDTVNFQAALSGQKITLRKGQLTINKDLTIDASSLAGGITIDANGAATQHRVIEIGEGAVAELKSLTVTGGATVDGLNPGGGIFNNRGNLTIRNCTVTGNSTGGPSGSPFTGGGHGGGICSLGELTVRGSVVSDNATGNGGALVGGGWGGGIYCTENLSIQNSTIEGNVTGNGGGSSAGGLGGGVYSGKGLVILNSTIAGNSTGRGSTGGQGGRIYSLDPMEISNSTIEGNSTGNGSSGNGGDGGGIYAATFEEGTAMQILMRRLRTTKPETQGRLAVECLFLKFRF